MIYRIIRDLKVSFVVPSRQERRKVCFLKIAKPQKSQDFPPTQSFTSTGSLIDSLSISIAFCYTILNFPLFNLFLRLLERNVSPGGRDKSEWNNEKLCRAKETLSREVNNKWIFCFYLNVFLSFHFHISSLFRLCLGKIQQVTSGIFFLLCVFYPPQENAFSLLRLAFSFAVGEKKKCRGAAFIIRW